MTSDLTATSRFLSYVLRHNPAAIGVRLDDSGWIDIDTLLAAATSHGRPIDQNQLGLVLSAPGKRRFEIRGGQIRAAQGHSVPVDLGLRPSQPPEQLYHGTVARFLDRIRAEGLTAQGRTHVHLSPDVPAARVVGARRGQPVVLVIRALAMHEQGYEFCRAANGVWLTSRVPPEWIGTDIG
jgi:putative RNA 2'-phosphotransferase